MVLSTVPASPLTCSHPGFVPPPEVEVEVAVAVVAVVSLAVLLAAPLPPELVLEPVVPPAPSLLLELVEAVLPCDVAAPGP